MAAYCLASAYYLVVTRTIGTPFKDSLTEEQLQIKKESSKVRRNIFCQGVLVSVLLLMCIRPFENCSCHV
jgi:hypothetical protein